MTPFDAIVRTPFAMIGIRSDLRAVSGVEYLRDDPPAMEPTNRLAARAVREIERYLDDPEYRFTVPLAVAGTPFQQRVRQAIAGIPVGESRTYAEIARAVRSSARAVGGACGRNRIALIVPCHRVVGSCGALGGFMNAAGGEPVAIKRWLLTHEGYRFGA